MERLCDWVVNKDKVWVHGDRITDGHVALDMRLTPGLDPGEVARDGPWVLRNVTKKTEPSLLTGGAAHRTVVGVVMPASIEGSVAVLEAIVQDLNV
ncbi:hypothetical protein [Streptomyces sp. NPDC087294]|uniref:hypothetical protein n=1 Tax=Streptomyces sp. NPDC087294 TaxID=3365777 RepID=UPI00380422AD